MHFGQDDPARNRASEAALIACLRHYEAQAERLYLVGDVFDQYIEYRSLVPRGAARFQGLLAAWTDRGIDVAYLLGNHDPWHRDYFREELGVRVEPDALIEPLYGLRVYIRHGDGLDPAARTYNRLKPWLRHPALVWAYRSLLPGDAGMWLAARARQKARHDAVDMGSAERLRRWAHRRLSEGAEDAVVLGHTHYPEQVVWPEGAYVNTGSWRENQTYACLDAEGLRLLSWNGGRPRLVERAAY